MEIIIKKDYKDLSLCAAEIIANLIVSKPNCTLGLATGATPLGTYRELVRMHREKGLDFSYVKTFNLDEYLGLGIDLSKEYKADQSYARFMYEEFFKYINIKKENIHIPDGLTKTPEKSCRLYDEEIKKAGGIDLQITGIGANGHIAFNEPGSSLASGTRVVALTRNTLDKNYEKFFKKSGMDKERMPHYALTMGTATILEARRILMLASGEGKAEIITEAIEGCVTSRVTASALQLYPGRLTVVLDNDAASKLTWSLRQ